MAGWNASIAIAHVGSPVSSGYGRHTRYRSAMFGGGRHPSDAAPIGMIDGRGNDFFLSNYKRFSWIPATSLAINVARCANLITVACLVARHSCESPAQLSQFTRMADGA